ncbi:MAG: penicillin-binding protein [Bacilli bacterium]|nr:penicillin-binding protein [Bacilli bacterium]
MANASKTVPKPKRKSKWTLRKTILWMLFTVGFAVICASVGYILIIYNGQNLLNGIDPTQLVTKDPTIIYDSNNQVIETIGQQKGQSVGYQDIPQKLLNAFIATEDRRFNEHSGIDFKSVGRAAVKDIINRSTSEGGSTITQQLAKNILFEHPKKTLFRKATELSLAMALEGKFSKNEIITMYLNRINFGSGAWGIKDAAKRYFGKDLKDLEVWQMATLAGIPKSPTNYSPISFPDKSKERRQVVLKLMLDQGYITEAEKNAAMDVNFVAPKQNSNHASSSFVDYTLDEAKALYGIDEEVLRLGGFKIYTTMDTNAQQIMEQTFENDQFFQKSDAQQKMQGAMVIVNQKNGGIVAMVGGRDYVDKGLNRVTVKQQPGSSFKPIVVYAPAIETGQWNPYSMLEDKEMNFNGYKPHNYDNNYPGQVSMFDAVKESINLPAVWLLDQIKLKTGMQFAKGLGIEFDPQDTNLAIALGGMTQGATPLQMAQAYSAFANNGAMNKAHAILKITNDNKEVTSYKAEKAKQVMSLKTAYYTTELLKGVIEPGGTGASAKMNRPVAGKTGSTQLTIKGLESKTRDLWFVGYTPEWTAAIWMGFDKPDKTHYVTIKSGSTAALFKEVMSKALAKVPVTNFTKPDGVPDLKAPPKGISDLSVVLDPTDNHKAKLNWTAVDDPSVAYRVFRKTAKDKDFTMLMEVKSVVDLYDITLTFGETYQYYVIAYNTDFNTESDKSNVADLAVPLTGISPSESPGISPTPTDSGTNVSPSPSSTISPTPSDSASPTPTNLASPTPTPTINPQ